MKDSAKVVIEPIGCPHPLTDPSREYDRQGGTSPDGTVVVTLSLGLSAIISEVNRIRKRGCTEILVAQ